MRTGALDASGRLKRRSTSSNSATQSEYISPGWIGDAYAGLRGREDEALDWLERAVDDGLGFVQRLNIDPMYDSLRSLPRCQALLRRMGF